MVQWLRLCLPIQEVKVQSLVGKLTSHMSHGQKPKQKQYSNKFNKDFSFFKVPLPRSHPRGSYLIGPEDPSHWHFFLKAPQVILWCTLGWEPSWSNIKPSFASSTYWLLHMRRLGARVPSPLPPLRRRKGSVVTYPLHSEGLWKIAILYTGGLLADLAATKDVSSVKIA